MDRIPDFEDKKDAWMAELENVSHVSTYWTPDRFFPAFENPAKKA
jgi:hypothetical protein